jgi:hypothetical protein
MATWDWSGAKIIVRWENMFNRELRMEYVFSLAANPSGGEPLAIFQPLPFNMDSFYPELK